VVETTLGLLQKNMREDVSGLYKELRHRDSKGCGFGRVLAEKQTQDRAEIENLKELPDRKHTRAAAVATLLATIIAAFALGVSILAVVLR